MSASLAVQRGPALSGNKAWVVRDNQRGNTVCGLPVRWFPLLKRQGVGFGPTACPFGGTRHRWRLRHLVGSAATRCSFQPSRSLVARAGIGRWLRRRRRVRFGERASGPHLGDEMRGGCSLAGRESRLFGGCSSGTHRAHTGSSMVRLVLFGGAGGGAGRVKSGPSVAVAVPSGSAAGGRVGARARSREEAQGSIGPRRRGNAARRQRTLQEVTPLRSARFGVRHSLRCLVVQELRTARGAADSVNSAAMPG